MGINYSNLFQIFKATYCYCRSILSNPSTKDDMEVIEKRKCYSTQYAKNSKELEF